MRLRQDLSRAGPRARAVLAGLALGVAGIAGARADEYLCTVSPTAANLIARSILVDIRMNLIALVFDSNIEAAYGAPIEAELVASRAEKYELKWQVQAQAMPASGRLRGGNGWHETVSYHATLNRRTMVFRITGINSTGTDDFAKGKCVRKTK